MRYRHYYTWMLLGIAVLMNLGLWLYARPLQAQWGGVPPAPGKSLSQSVGLGDPQFSYRIYATSLQNLGSTGGKAISLQDYDYTLLARWFHVMDKLDPVSSYTPFLAGYYYGAVQDPTKLDHVIDFLVKVGKREGRERWRWLVHAVFLARHKQEDMDKAARIAHHLADHPDPDKPDWTLRMPAMIYYEQGKEEAALAIFVNILKSADDIHVNEKNFIAEYICDKILEKGSARHDQLCKAPKD